MTVTVAPAPPLEFEPKLHAHPSRIIGVGTAVSEVAYSQRALLDLFGITDPRIRSVFLNSAIERRHLTLPPRDTEGAFLPETQKELLAKHKRIALDMGARAVRACLAGAGIDLADVDYLCCVTTTGYLTPGLSALLIRDMGLDPGCTRVDVVGMGCNAGLNALNATAAWSVAHPGQVAVLLCAEACSAAYVMDATMRTAVVNSLFGDGAAAIALLADPPDAAGPAPGDLPDGAAGSSAGPRLLGFASHLITDAIGAMRYDWDDDQHKFSFYLDPDIPYVVGAHAERVVDRLLAGAGLRRSDIAHWLVHSGGKKVIDAVRVNLGLTRHDLRHTTGVLRDYGNLSSGSFLFSYERLVREDRARAGDYGVLMTMGPGSTIETALVQW
ncbi:3,5-dihydroxyphenylacetyl-CoA synthase DpgA [Streptomyces sp. NL15-2K]|uniref:3,5-dihydroxyphenylacetyl-CoA synthase DpgA n=1 Tax=Streptomyces sp. NL15-2K TaxID=376149 RepID=UPI000F562478|nr:MULTISPECIES: 3,5-dihydroxyphenylacetyl-CoA synthase DpgA [Actinomycetes]WKX06850.1 type III polyketide synthase [Kutzneria buriramensis]GCB43867.1 chalcone and stilbene synthases-like [Streptomyces sp. NL15-2K]